MKYNEIFSITGGIVNSSYKRVLIKLSGEALAGTDGFGLDPQILNKISSEIKQIHDLGIQVALVVGGGNFWRGRYSQEMDAVSADYMGMLATVINGLALQNHLENAGVPTRVQSALKINSVCEPYIKRKAVKHLEKGRVVIFTAGTGNPFFTTDTAASLRAIEIGADALLLAKNVDAVYDKDPNDYPDAKKYTELTYNQVIQEDLKVMDQTAVTLCKENNMPIQVFGLKNPENLIQAVQGINTGTKIN